MDEKKYTLEELANLSGYSRRTIRYYIAEGILSGPVTMGRGAEYTEEHLQRLQAIGKLQGEGRTIPEIRLMLEMGKTVQQAMKTQVFDPQAPKQMTVPVSVSWEDVPCSEYIRVQIRVDAPEGLRDAIQQAVANFIVATLKDERKENEDA